MTKNEALFFSTWMALMNACGDSDSDLFGNNGNNNSDVFEIFPETDCVDESWATIECPVETHGKSCNKADANECMNLQKTELQVFEATSDQCLRLVFENQCSEEIYSYVCIEYSLGSNTEWQCWTSSTGPFGTIDISQCGATGNFYYYASDSSGKLTSISKHCSPE